MSATEKESLDTIQQREALTGKPTSSKVWELEKPGSSRRGFLLSAAALSAGLFLSPRAFGKSASPAPAATSAAGVASAPPQRVILSCAADPAHMQSVVWRAAGPLATPQAQLAPLSASPGFDKEAQTFPAVAQTPFEAAGGGDAYHYAATFKDLQPGGQYCYRTGDGETWSEWNVFQTASEKPAPFRFIYVGDVQNDIRMMCSRTMRRAFQHAPDARFVVYAGDLVTDGWSDALWDEFAYANSVLSAMIPALPTPGNHDTHHKAKSKVPPYPYNADLAYHGHFCLPENGPSDAPELSQEAYYVDYQGVRMISINSNALEDDAPAKIRDAQLAWLDALLRDNPNRWTICTHHHPIYSTSKNRDNEYLRGLLRPLYDKYHVDLVLQGHDHSYGRTHKAANDRAVEASEPGTVYAVSVAGPKMYDIGAKFEPLMAKLFGQKQMYQIISVDGDTLTYDACAVDGQRMDGFQLEKDAKGVSTYTSAA